LLLLRAQLFVLSADLCEQVQALVARKHVQQLFAFTAEVIAAHARQTLVMLKATKRSFVERLDFRTSGGFLEGGDSRERSGARGGGPGSVITDFGILAPEPATRELELRALFPEATVEEARAAVGWPLRVAATLDRLEPPAAVELAALRDLHARTREAHARPVHLPA